MSKKLAAATVAALTLVVGTGCSSAPDTRPASKQSEVTSLASDVDASVVRGRAEYDFPQTKSITAASQKASRVLVGEVVEWSEGRTTVESDDPSYEAVSHNAVLTIKVTKSYGSSPPTTEELVYVEVPRGGEVRVDGEVPQGTTPVLATVAELSAAVPAGTEVILLANPARNRAQLMADTPGLVVQNEGEGVPSGAELLGPTIQGLLFRDETGAFASGLADGEGDWGWLPAGTRPERGFATLVAELNSRR